MILSFLALVMIGAVFCLIASIFITITDPKFGLQLAGCSFLTILIDLLLLSLF